MQFGWLLVTAEFHDVYVADAAAGTDAGQRGGFYDDRREIERERERGDYLVDVAGA